MSVLIGWKFEIKTQDRTLSKNNNCKYRNKFSQLGIRNRIEYMIFYLFLVNIIGNCHENKYIWICGHNLLFPTILK
jgi:hypothetical protein